MSYFTSKREKRLWIGALVVFLAVTSTLFLGQPLARLFESQDVRAVIFLLGMALVGTAIIIHAIKNKPGRIEYSVIFGLLAVYTMFILRLGMPERSHLIEYSALAILIHRALIERVDHGKKMWHPALVAFIIALSLGTLDESLQLLIPDRYFDPVDIFFNGMAAAMAIGASVLLAWVRKISRKSK